jgi:hypothetical protein
MAYVWQSVIFVRLREPFVSSSKRLPQLHLSPQHPPLLSNLREPLTLPIQANYPLRSPPQPLIDQLSTAGTPQFPGITAWKSKSTFSTNCA